MPACGCPDTKLEDGSIRKCACQPCSEGNLSGCSCNKDTGCACMNSSPSKCVCGEKCTCSNCSCTQAEDKKVDQAPQSCCASKGGDSEKKQERSAGAVA
ncbi:hypothetical protein P389DRAFT_64234 [Cystobasidium minutum MCA 4210]|uniref:uncharacterized protein n=1 Tax=Cystobasidium minutum MCA 4210 TaxID=1397322 RepID=UPI0034CFBF89|eukprot:jgi/Rhomi1/64234/CE64233_687